MSKYRIYELAKNYNTTSKVIIDILSRHNISAKNHMSSVDEEVKAIIDRTFAPKDKPVENQTPRPESNSTKSKPFYKEQPKMKQTPASNRQNTNSPNRQQSYSQNRPNRNNQQPHSMLNNSTTGANRPAQTTHSNTPGNQRFNNRPPVNNINSNTSNQRQDKKASQPATETRPGTRAFSSKKNDHKPTTRGSDTRHQINKHKQRNPLPKIKEHIMPKSIQMGETISVKEFAEKIGREVAEVIKKLMLLGVMATINQEIDYDTATLIAEDFNVKVEPLPPELDPTEIPDIEDDPKTLQARPPVVTVMGHVDHGKTSLLDAIRRTNVTAHEAGGITQHIGAYQVICQGKKIVFLDTPGHEAFTAMRARGAQVTDISILVVAADDGVMPQTIEAINHSKSAKVPIIVAINKIDRPNANPDKVKQQLAEYNLIPEDWGGDTIMVEVSAHQKTGINDLLEMILLVAEMQELKANPNRQAQGTIVEAQLDKGRGPVATVLVQKGSLHIGDTIIAGTAFGKVRAMVNDRGEKIKKALPSTPVEVLGLSDVPKAGDILYVTDEKIARAVSEKRVAKKRTDEMEQSQKVSLDDLFKQIQQGNIKDLNIVVKADVQGSIEAMRQSLLNIKNEEVKVNVVHSGVGAINESDVMLASASNALIIGFNVRPDNNARKAAENEKIDIRTYRVIYEALNDVEAAIKGMLAPTYREVIQGRVEVRKIFTISKVNIAGCYVLEGKITNSSQIRVIRDGIVIHEGVLDTLRRFKDDVKEVSTGYECGITLEKFRDIKEGDILEAFTMEEVK